MSNSDEFEEKFGGKNLVYVFIVNANKPEIINENLYGRC